MKELYKKFIRKAFSCIVYDIQQCKEDADKQRAELKQLATRISRLEENIRKNNERINALERLGNETRVGRLEENVRVNNDRLNALERAGDEKRIIRLEDNTRTNNDRLNALERVGDEKRIIRLEDNIRKNNLRINELEKADSKIEMNMVKIKGSMNAAQRQTVSVSKETRDGKQTDMLQTVASAENEYSKIDYFDFENHFRGSCQNVKDRQKMYIPYFKNCSIVVDLGCGRGEFLELLKENGISAKGVDLYDEYAEYCRMKDLDVVQGDAIEYLSGNEKVDGIMAAQLVEHLDTNQIVTLCENAYKSLTETGVFIMETPNPTSLSIYVNEFYLDPSHEKPVHPQMLKYLVEKAGFRDVEIVYTEVSRVGKTIPELRVNAEGNFDEFNTGMKEVADLLYGSRDYAIIARK